MYPKDLGFRGQVNDASREVTYVFGLYKIFDEILIYATNNKQRDPSMDSLSVGIDVSDCRISIYYIDQGSD